MLWTKRFKQDSEYQAYIQGDDVIKPNVSVCETAHHVHYNPGPPIDKPDRNRYGVIEIGNIEPFNYEGGVETGITLTTNSTNTWALTQKSSWLHVSPNRGTGSTTLTVECDEYENDREDREGFFTVRYTMPDARYSTTKYGIIQTKAPLNPKNQYLTFEILEDGNITWNKYNNYTATTKTIQYSKDNGETWTNMTGGTIPVLSGDTVLFKGDNDTYRLPVANQAGGYHKLTCSGRFNISGNIMSLINSTYFSGLTSLTTEETFYSIFNGNAKLVSIENLLLPATELSKGCYRNMFGYCTSLTGISSNLLPATTLAPTCYSYMFNGCTGLTTIPSNLLPATNLSGASGCYSSMFSNCTNLTTAPALPATDLSGANSCYNYMFNGCTSLTTAPALPATTLAPACYSQMFSGCTSLITIPSILPATDLSGADECYSYMFLGCTGLTTAPTLPATTLAPYCYSSMFRDCTSLTTAPELPGTILLAPYCYFSMFRGCTSLITAPSSIGSSATTLMSGCCSSMFNGCTSLTTVPVLPATTMAYDCYSYMFQDCTSLTTVPSNMLPATTLRDICYASMFQGCTGLTKAPDLLATGEIPNAIFGGAYKSMFSGCTSLNYIKCFATRIQPYFSTGCWVAGVASAGTFVINPESTVAAPESNLDFVSGWTIGTSGIPTNWIVLPTNYLTFEILEDGDIGWKCTYTSLARTIEYSKDNGQTWSAITSTSAGVTIPVLSGETVQFRGDNLTYASGNSASDSMSRYNYFTSTCNFNVKGKLHSLARSKTHTAINGASGDFCFAGLFMNCTKLINANELILPYSLNSGCYRSLFQGCTSLVTVPKLNNVYTHGNSCCYAHMFQGCTSLTGVPSDYLSVITELSTNSPYYCYAYMFSYCTGLTDVSQLILPATSVSSYGYEGMFQNCTSLTSAPELPAPTLTPNCYQQMFANCTNLNYIKCLATDISATDCTTNWINGVQTTSGTFVKNPSMTGWTTGDNGIPSNWTVEDAT